MSDPTVPRMPDLFVLDGRVRVVMERMAADLASGRRTPNSLVTDEGLVTRSAWDGVTLELTVRPL